MARRSPITQHTERMTVTRRARVACALLASVALAALLAAAAVAQDGREADGEQTTVRVALNGYENNLTPFTLTFASLPNTHDMINLVYDSLFWSQVRQDPEPWLAESATPSDDARTWTVKLRPNLTWHDGRPLTAQDVKFSFDYYLEHAGVAGRYAHHVSEAPPYDSAEVVDERTVRLRFKRPAPTFEILPGADLPIVPKHVWEDVEEPGKASEQLPVGSGPYKLVEIVPDQRYRFVANEDYFKGRPVVDELEMPIVQDPNAAFQALRAGQVDSVAVNVPPELVDRFSDLEDLETAKSTKFQSVQLYFNARKRPLTDPQLRNAISLGIDAQAIVQRVLQGQGEVGNDSFLHPDVGWAINTTHRYDPERAKGMLDAAGYRDGDGDGVREGPDGKPLRFSVLVSSFEPDQLRAAQLTARQVSEIGVRLAPEAIDPATLRTRRSPPEDGGPPPYDIYASDLEQHAHVDPDALYYFFHSPGEKGFGNVITGWSNRRFDRLSERAISLSIEERTPLLTEMQQILASEQPLVTLWYRQGTWAYRPAAYDGWVTDRGHGILTKRSFLRPYVDTAAVSGPGGDQEGGGSTLWIVLGVVAVVGIALATLLVVRRRRTAEDQGFE